MNTAWQSRPVRWLGIVAAAIAAACFAIFFFDLLTPPRPMTALLPTRTPTRRPPPTITPVAYPPTPPVALRDDFSSTDNFPRSTGDAATFGYDGDAYQLSPPVDPGFVRALDLTFQENEYRNLSLETVAGPAPDSAPVDYGVLFWHSRDEEGMERFLAVTLGSDSTVQLLAFEPITSTEQGKNAFQFTQVIPPVKTSAVTLDGTPNRLRVDVHPRRLLVYVNDELVMDTDNKIINDWRLRRDFDGQVGLIALAHEPGAQARFTQFDIYADVPR